MPLDPVEQVVASARLEGVEPSPEAVADMRRCAAGEITHDELMAVVLARVTRQPTPH